MHAECKVCVCVQAQLFEQSFSTTLTFPEEEGRIFFSSFSKSDTSRPTLETRTLGVGGGGGGGREEGANANDRKEGSDFLHFSSPWESWEKTALIANQKRPSCVAKHDLYFGIFLPHFFLLPTPHCPSLPRHWVGQLAIVAAVAADRKLFFLLLGRRVWDKNIGHAVLSFTTQGDSKKHSTSSQKCKC